MTQCRHNFKMQSYNVRTSALPPNDSLHVINIIKTHISFDQPLIHYITCEPDMKVKKDEVVRWLSSYTEREVSFSYVSDAHYRSVCDEDRIRNGVITLTVGDTRS